MRVFNLTDIETPVLTQRGLVGQHIAVGSRMVAPGEYVDVEDTESVESKLEYVLTVGAVSVGVLPPAYVMARQAKDASAGHLSAIPVRHIDLQETKVAGELIPAPEVATGPAVELDRWDPSTEPGDPEESKKKSPKRK